MTQHETTTPVICARTISVTYRARSGARIKAVDGVSFDVLPGKTLGIVGESGSGKTSLGRALLGLLPDVSGEVEIAGLSLIANTARETRKRRQLAQMVFQDPSAALNPRHRVATLIGEPLRVHGLPGRHERVLELLARVGLPPDARHRYPHEFSGGQRQRIAIARALALKPRLLIADEPVSSLDVSIQAQIINLLADLKAELQLAMIFISHDLSVVRHVADTVAVMYLGRFVEMGRAAQVLEKPRHPYTRTLLDAIPRLERRPERAATSAGDLLVSEPADPANPPSGCAFHPRCGRAMPRCLIEAPKLGFLGRGEDTQVACHDPITGGWDQGFR